MMRDSPRFLFDISLFIHLFIFYIIHLTVVA